MEAALKKGVVLVVVLFLCFYFFTDPSGAAHAARVGGEHLAAGLGQLFRAMTDFLNALFS
ncbi:MAG TPA: hypothetical protein VFR99_07660 [Marmoricola sp.]|jgi:hypothetical protein|nr:hypothetical protein [Marmoricola sp.]